MATLYLVRHGHIESQGRFTGQTDKPLSPLGHEQAARLGKLLEQVKFDCCFCSPLLRALETARHILAANNFYKKPHKERRMENWCRNSGFLAAGEYKDGNAPGLGNEPGFGDAPDCDKKPDYNNGPDCNIAFANSMFIVPELMEISLGLWEGMRKEEVISAYPEIWKERGDAPALVPPSGGESYPMLHERLRPFFRIMAMLLEKKNILVVAHRSVNQVITGKLSLFPLENWPAITMLLGSVTLCPVRESVLHTEPVLYGKPVLRSEPVS